MALSKETRLALVENASRWTCNILVEVLGSHGEVIPAETREALQEAVSALGKAGAWIRRDR